MPSPFNYYNSSFNAINIINKYAAKDLKTTAGIVTNFLGLKIKPEYMPEQVRSLQGTIESIPIPGNWHADIAEWGAVLRSIDLAQGPNFVMGEIGCGWGCWMGNAGLAAKQKNYKCKLYGIDAYRKHINWAHENLSLNGFSEQEIELVYGIAAARSGKALFPIIDVTTVHYGLEPIFNATIEEVNKATLNRTHELVPIIPLNTLFLNENRVDLLHLDIQGGEVDFVQESMDYILDMVSYIIIGTHSRAIEGRLMEIFSKAGWLLEIERPAIFNINDKSEIFLTVDGVQAWKNPKIFGTPSSIKSSCMGENILIKYVGWHNEEKTHRWTNGNESHLIFTIDSKKSLCKKISICGIACGMQHLKIEINDKTIFNCTVSGDDVNLELDIPSNCILSGENTLKFYLPDAFSPGSHDKRVLGFGLKEINIH